MELTELYREVILDHNRHPRNFGRLDPHDAEGKGHNPLCGDRLTITLNRDGTNISDSRSVEQHSPFTSCEVRPASANASAARSAHCSRVKRRSPRYFRSGAYSAIPAMTASPRNPTFVIL